MSEPVVMRVGDRERGEVDAVLRDALADGVLTLTEYDERARLCWAARTRPELDEVVRDLPGCAPAVAVARPGQATQRVLAVLSESDLEAPLLPGQDVQATAVMGTAEVDLRREDLPHELTVRATAVMGEVKVHVPPGTTVHLSGGAVMGERKARVGAPVPGGPVVHVVANALMGTVKVDDRPRKGGLVPAAVQGGSYAYAPRPRTSVEVEPARHHGPGVLARAAGAVVPVAVAGVLGFGLLQVVGSDDGAAVFGSRVVQVGEDDDRVQVGVLFGSTTVVVPDDARVRTRGMTLFGSVDCDACTPVGTGSTVVVDGRGAFGSVEIVRASAAGRDDG
jgi:hypothetical protein